MHTSGAHGDGHWHWDFFWKKFSKYSGNRTNNRGLMLPLLCTMATMATMPDPRTYAQSTTQNTNMATMPDPALERCSSCFFPTEFHDAPLVAVKQYNHDTKIFTFGLPPGVSLDLPVCSCILVKGANAEGEPAIRPYTPTSSNEQKDSFDLMVKVFRLFLSVCACKHAFGTESAVEHICSHMTMAWLCMSGAILPIVPTLCIYIYVCVCVNTHKHTHTHTRTHKHSNTHQRKHTIHRSTSRVLFHSG